MSSKLIGSFPVKIIDTIPKKYAQIAFEALNLIETENYQNYIDRHLVMDTESHKSMKLIVNEFNNNIIGCLQLFKGNIWGIGILNLYRSENILNSVVDKIINIKLDTLFLPDYLAQKILKREKNYKKVYTRFCLRLNLKEFQEDAHINRELGFYKINEGKDIEKLRAIYLGSFKGSIDERLGLFNSRRVHVYLKAVFNGNFGKFSNQCSWMNDYSAILVTEINERVAFIPILGVKKAEQKRKVGFQLITKAVMSCKKSNIKVITLWVTEENSAAMKLYLKLGFKKTDVNEEKLSKKRFWL